MGNRIRSGFGWIEIGGVRYDHDVIIRTDGTVAKRRKKASSDLRGGYGHTPLSEAELDFLGDEGPEVVFVGTGQYGDLPITPAATRILRHYDTVIRDTPSILPAIESESRRYIAIIHVTC